MRATRDGDDYVLNGSKRFITHGSSPNVLTVFALTDPAAGGRKGMSAFIVETDTPGFAAPRVEHKMGIRGSPTAELTFDDVRVPRGQPHRRRGRRLQDRDGDAGSHPG